MLSAGETLAPTHTSESQNEQQEQHGRQHDNLMSKHNVGKRETLHRTVDSSGSRASILCLLAAGQCFGILSEFANYQLHVEVDPAQPLCIRGLTKRYNGNIPVGHKKRIQHFANLPCKGARQLSQNDYSEYIE